MGKWLRELWAELFAAGVLSVINTVASYLHALPPIITFAIWFVIILIAFRIMAKYQEKRLKHRLQIDRERWNKLREEKIKLRQQYSNRMIIPDLLYKMSERVRKLMEDNPMILVTNDFDESITADFKELMQAKHIKKIELNKTDMLKTLTRFPALRKYKNPVHQVRALAISLYQVFASHGEGAMPLVEKDHDYQQLNKKIEKYLVGLPQSIHVKKDSHIQLANAYYTIMAIDFSKVDLPALVRLSQPLFGTGVESELSAIRADISSSIEKFLTGDDVK